MPSQIVQPKFDCLDREFDPTYPVFWAIGTKYYYDRIGGCFLRKVEFDAKLVKEGKTMKPIELGTAADITTWKNLGHLYSGV